MDTFSDRFLTFVIKLVILILCNIEIYLIFNFLKYAKECWCNNQKLIWTFYMQNWRKRAKILVFIISVSIRSNHKRLIKFQNKSGFDLEDYQNISIILDCRAHQWLHHHRAFSAAMHFSRNLPDFIYMSQFDYWAILFRNQVYDSHL